MSTAVLVYVLGFSSAAMLGIFAYPPIFQRLKDYASQRAKEASHQLEDMFLVFSHNRLQLVYLGAAPGLFLLGLLFTGNLWISLAIGSIGLCVPKLMLKVIKAQRKNQFHKQLVDSLLLLSSCLRAGLSILQSFTVVAEEMPAPVNQEFGLILKETRMGISLDEAMAHFLTRNPGDDTNLFVTAILVARETGGDITAIFIKLVETLRERNKIKEKIKTLTFMARLQGIVMALLPIVFCVIIYGADKSHFDFFLTDPMGRLMLAGVVGAQIISALLMMRFGRSPL